MQVIIIVLALIIVDGRIQQATLTPGTHSLVELSQSHALASLLLTINLQSAFNPSGTGPSIPRQARGRIHVPTLTMSDDGPEVELTRRTIGAQVAALLTAWPLRSQMANAADLVWKVAKRPLRERSSYIASTRSGKLYRAVAVLAGGFLIPKEQYESYRLTLEELGVFTVLYADPLTISDINKRGDPRPLVEAATNMMELLEESATDEGVDSSLPLLLVGHSRGCKTVIQSAAELSLAKRPFAGMVLIDPVDKTDADRSSVMKTIKQYATPTLILGSGKSQYDCALTDDNYEVFGEALQDATVPHVVGKLLQAGHLQFLDSRQNLTVDVCRSGKDKDASVREVAQAAIKVWVNATLVEDEFGVAAALKDAAQTLQTTKFPAQVEWYSYL